MRLDDEPGKGGVAPEQVAGARDGRRHAAAPAAARAHVHSAAGRRTPRRSGRPFRQLRELLERLNAAGFQLDTLSMGMSDDLEAAVLEGATIVRVGTAIFGPRPA